jgi:hypothetical protein
MTSTMPDRRGREQRLLRSCIASLCGILIGCAILGWAAGVAVSRHPQPLGRSAWCTGQSARRF